MSKEPSRRYAIITGAASGLGRAIGVRLARDSWHVALADVDLDGCQESARLVERAGGSCQIELLDVTQPDAWTELIARLHDQWPRLDLLVNNAGVACAGEIGASALADWHWAIEVNLFGTIYGCHACREWLVKGSRGHIVNVASAAALVSGPAMGAYNVSKAGVVALSETLFAELRGQGVGVTVVCPGFFNTNLLAGGRFHKPEQRDAAARFMQRARTSADDVADTVVRAIARRKLYVVVPRRARVYWLLRRLCPTTMMRFVAWLYGRREEQTETSTHTTTTCRAVGSDDAKIGPVGEVR